MGKLIYIANVSLDGYIEDSHGNFDWSAPDDEVLTCRPPRRSSSEISSPTRSVT
jgi:hypothetical protein